MSEPSEGALKFADEALANARRYEPPEEDDFRDAIALVVDAAIQAERAKSGALADAMWQLLDDMGENGHGVCAAAKAQARIAYEPFNDEPGTLDYSLAAAEAVIRDIDRPASAIRSRK